LWRRVTAPVPSLVLPIPFRGPASSTYDTRPIATLFFNCVPFSLFSCPQEPTKAQLAWPHIGDTLFGWLRYTHARSCLSLSFIPLLLPLYICFPPRFPLFDPVGALLKDAAALDDGEFRLREADCCARFAVGLFGLFEGLRPVSGWHIEGGRWTGSTGKEPKQ